MHYTLIVGVYGDVYRVKMLFNKKDTALIQMAEPHQAQTGKKTYIFMVINCYLKLIHTRK